MKSKPQSARKKRGWQKRVVIPRRPTAYDRGQHELICTALKVSELPDAPGDTAYEAVCELLYKVDIALAATTLKAAKKALRIKPGSMSIIPLYGTAARDNVQAHGRRA